MCWRLRAVRFAVTGFDLGFILRFSDPIRGNGQPVMMGHFLISRIKLKVITVEFAHTHFGIILNQPWTTPGFLLGQRLSVQISSVITSFRCGRNRSGWVAGLTRNTHLRFKLEAFSFFDFIRTPNVLPEGIA